MNVFRLSKTDTYNPEQTIRYKASYVENVIFTKDFEKVMENEYFQNDWILQMHDFMVKELELSKDVGNWLHFILRWTDKKAGNSK